MNNLKGGVLWIRFKNPLNFLKVVTTEANRCWLVSARRWGSIMTWPFRSAGAFGGMCSYQGLCGAIVSSHMILGLLPPLDDPGGKKRPCRQAVYNMVNEYNACFKKKFGHLLCHDLLGVNPGTKVGFMEAEARGLFVSHCPQYVQEGAQMLKDIINKMA
jgi:hypothetical protein